MRQRLILAVLIFIGMLSVPASLLGQRDSGHHQLSVRQEVDLELLNLQKNIGAAGNRAESLKSLEKSLARMKSLRRSGPVQWSQDEIQMDRMMGSLEEVNQQASSFKDNCEPVRARLLRLYDPRAHGKSEDSSLQGSLAIWSDICHKKN